MSDVPRTTVLMFGALAGPVAWVAQFTAHYTATPFLCEAPWTPLLHVATVAFLILAGAGLVVSLRSWRQLADAASSPDPIARRARSLAGAGILSSCLFLVAIVATGIPALMVDPCRH